MRKTFDVRRGSCFDVLAAEFILTFVCTNFDSGAPPGSHKETDNVKRDLYHFFSQSGHSQPVLKKLVSLYNLLVSNPPGWYQTVWSPPAFIQTDTGCGTGFCLMSVNKRPYHAPGLSKQKNIISGVKWTPMWYRFRV